MRRLLVSLALTALVFGSACGCGDRSQSAKRAGDSVTPAAESAEAASAAESQIQAGLPDDIPIPDGLRATSVSSEEPGSLVALFTGDLEPDQVARLFADGLKKQGWAIDQSGRPGGELGVFARKQQRIASVVVTRLAGKLHVELGVWAPKE